MAAIDYRTSATRIDGTVGGLDEFRGKVLLVVNTASRCGFTPQYEGLERLWRDHADRGLVVLGFPCDQFGRQEPGTESQIAEFCTSRFAVTFPMFSKIEVNGRGAHPLFTQLKDAAPGLFGTRAIKWNFTKFLIDRAGNVVRRYGPRVTPAAMAGEVQELLAAGP